MPLPGPSLNSLISGSIFVGEMNFSGKNITLRNIGVDHGETEFPSTVGNAIKISYSAGDPSDGENDGGNCFLENVIGLCKVAASPAEASHAILVEGYAYCDLKGLYGIRGNFNVALKVQRANIDGVICVAGGTDCFILKADDQFGDADYVNVNGLNIAGALGDTQNLIRIEAFSNQMERMNFSNLVGN
ncbi:MAG: hypothetical protein R3213_11480, partial [Flavobacteriaceae bacterium]|nr:hypothetical protein [Flavobacteriaceae bacterium]